MQPNDALAFADAVGDDAEFDLRALLQRSRAMSSFATDVIRTRDGCC